VAKNRARVCRLDHASHQLGPGAESSKQIVFMTARPGLFSSGLFGHASPIDLVVGNVECEELRTATKPIDAVAGRQLQPIALHDTAPDRRSQVHGVAISKEAPAHAGTQPFRADEHVARYHGAFSQADPNVGFVLLEIRHLRSEVESLFTEVRSQPSVESPAMHEGDI